MKSKLSTLATAAAVAAAASVVVAFRPGADPASAETSRLAAEELRARLAAAESRPKQGPWIRAEQPVFDCGTIEAGAAVRHTFKLANMGTEPVTIEKARTNGDCGTFQFTREIPPGGEGSLTIHIPADHVVPGRMRTTITLDTNSRGDDELVVSGRVVARAASDR